MSNKVLWLSQAEVESLDIPMEEIIAAVEEGWRLKGEGKVEMPAKIGIHPRKDCYIHAMPCWIGGDIDTCGEKWVSGFPMNHSKGMPYNIGLFILTDSDDGHMKAVMDATWITTWRTGAASAVIAKYLAAPTIGKLAIIGCGTQGRINLHAIKTQFPELKTVGVYFQGYPTEKEIYAEMSEIIVGKKPVVREGRRTAAPMGIACNDVMTARIVYEKALTKNIGTWVEH